MRCSRTNAKSGYVTVTERFIKMAVSIALNAHYGMVAEATSLCAKRQHITTNIQKSGNMTEKGEGNE